MNLRYSSNCFKIYLVVVFFGCVSGCAGHIAKNDTSTQIPLTVLFLNDLHGYLMPFEVKSGQGSQ